MPTGTMVVDNGLKQVIVVRNDLNMRKGKMVAQGTHAAVLSVLTGIDSTDSKMVWKWLQTGKTTICVRIDTESDLFDLVRKAKDAGLICELIRDAGLTEFKEPTYTCCAIGPGAAADIDKITGHLKLL